MPRNRLERTTALVTSVSIGATLGLLVASLEIVAVLAGILGAAGLYLLVRTLVGAGERRPIAWLVAAAYSVHLALMAVLHYTLVVLGRGGFVTGDDFGYADLSWRLAQWLRGAPADINWSAESYLVGNFIWLETGIFYIFGPAVLVMKVLNAVFLIAVVILLYDAARRLFGERAAVASALTVAAFPSLAVWTALNLKDAFALALIAAIVWALVRFAERPAWRPLVGALLALLVLESVRRYVFLLLAIVIPVAVIVGVIRTIGPRAGVRYGLVAIAACALLTAGSGNGVLGVTWVGTEALSRLETGRAWMAASARSAIDSGGGRPVIAQPGDTFVVVVDSTAPATATQAGATPPPKATGATPSPTPRTIVVEPFTRILLETPPPAASVRPSPTPSQTQRGVVYVRPSDIIKVSGGTSGAPSTPPRPLLVGGDERRPPPEIRTSDSLAAPAVAARSLLYLPRGYAHVLLAPFPWAPRSLNETVTIPDVLLWYVVLGAAAWTMWTQRRRWRELVTPALYLIGLFTILALAEGNIGTLYRHRAMAMPVAAMLAGPGLVAAVSAVRIRLRRA